MDGPWDYDNEICKGCPARDLVKGNEGLCEPCRALLRLHLNIEKTLERTREMVEDILA